MKNLYKKLLEGNKLFAPTRLFQDPDFFKICQKDNNLIICR